MRTTKIALGTVALLAATALAAEPRGARSPVGGGKAALARYFASLPPHLPLVPPPPPPPPPPRAANAAPRGMRVTLASTNATVDDSFAWSAWALAGPPWSRAEAASFALGGAGNFARVDWGGIAEYACQGALIAEKLLCMGDAGARAQVQQWLLTMPVSAAGQAWEAQNAQWHVQTQGAWESSAEALLMLRHLAAHSAAPLALAPERLLCASRDGGASFALAGVAQPGLADAACAAAPAALLATQPLAGGACGGAAAALFADAPSAPFPGPNAERDNGGRLLAQALALAEGGTTHLALALAPKASGADAWPAAVAVFDVASGLVVARGAVPAGGAPRDAWTQVDVRDSQGRALPAGLYLVVLAADDDSGGAGNGGGGGEGGDGFGGAAAPRPQDSWFLSPSWVSNACPGAGGGASHATYGLSPLWTRNATAAPSAPRLAAGAIASADEAAALEARRVRAAALAGAGGLGVSLAQQAALLLSFCLALSSQTPSVAAPGGYDVFVIPDLYFRGSLEDGVNSACSYYDLLRIGFASSYISLRALEAVEAFRELQAAGAVPGACAAGASAFGLDNALVLEAGATPCYSTADAASAAASLRAAIGLRFGDAATGEFVDWLGCSSMRATGGDTTRCELQNAVGGALPAGSPLEAVRTGFLPTLALAAKLGVPAGGGGGGGSEGANATRRAFAAARDAAREGAFYGAGWFHNALRGLEANAGGARSLIVQQNWQLTDADGFAIHSVNETGDWHIYSPAFIAGGGPSGYGQFEAQAENGGRFFSTTAFVFEGGVGADGAAEGSTPAPYPYSALLDDWLRAVRDISAVGAQLQANDTSTPLLAADAAFLSAPVRDPVVFELCAAVRAQFGFKNISDFWGAFLCDYYQDLPFALPENGVFLVSAAKALLGLRVLAGGTLSVNGAARRVAPGMPPWRADGPLPTGWPADAARVELFGVAAAGVAVDVDCAADAAAGTLACGVALSAGQGRGGGALDAEGAAHDIVL